MTPVKARLDLEVAKAIRGDIWTWGMKGFAIPFKDIVHLGEFREVMPVLLTVCKCAHAGGLGRLTLSLKGVPGEIAASPTFRRGEGKRGHP